MKAGEDGIRPSTIDAHPLVESLGFRHVKAFMPSSQVSYLRKRMIDGVEVMDEITFGYFCYNGRPGTLEAKHAELMAGSSANGDGITKLQEDGKSLEEIFAYHSLRTQELSEELSQHFDIVHTE